MAPPANPRTPGRAQPAPGHVLNVDDRGASRAVAEHLIALGHERFAVVLGFDKPWSTAEEAERSTR